MGKVLLLWHSRIPLFRLILSLCNKAPFSEKRTTFVFKSLYVWCSIGLYPSRALGVCLYTYVIYSSALFTFFLLVIAYPSLCSQFCYSTVLPPYIGNHVKTTTMVHNFRITVFCNAKLGSSAEEANLVQTMVQTAICHFCLQFSLGLNFSYSYSSGLQYSACTVLQNISRLLSIFSSL